LSFDDESVVADPWIGKRVFVKPGAEATVEGTRVEINVIPFPANVAGVNGEWLWLQTAWVRKSDIMLAPEALEYYSEQVRLDPMNAGAWFSRAEIYRHNSDFDGAIKDYAEAIRLDPGLAFGYIHRGIALVKKGELDHAIQDFTEAARIDPGNSIAFNKRGEAWQEKR